MLGKITARNPWQSFTNKHQATLPFSGASSFAKKIIYNCGIRVLASCIFASSKTEALLLPPPTKLTARFGPEPEERRRNALAFPKSRLPQQRHFDRSLEK